MPHFSAIRTTVVILRMVEGIFIARSTVAPANFDSPGRRSPEPFYIEDRSAIDW